MKITHIDPYSVLGVARDAGEAVVRKRYLELVRAFPPDRDPERFAEVRAAFEAIRDPVQRVEDQLFEIATNDSLEAIAADIRARLGQGRIPLNILLALADL